MSAELVQLAQVFEVDAGVCAEGMEGPIRCSSEGLPFGPTVTGNLLSVYGT